MDNYYGIVGPYFKTNGFLTRKGKCFQTNFVPSSSLFSGNASEALSLLVQNKLRMCWPPKLGKNVVTKAELFEIREEIPRHFFLFLSSITLLFNWMPMNFCNYCDSQTWGRVKESIVTTKGTVCTQRYLYMGTFVHSKINKCFSASHILGNVLGVRRTMDKIQNLTFWWDLYPNRSV